MLPSTMGLLSLYLGLEKLKDRTIKSSTMSQVLCSTIIPEFFVSFQNKTQSFHCMTLLSLSIYVVFVNPHQDNDDITPFSSYN
jgi:predicted transcriptional regulator